MYVLKKTDGRGGYVAPAGSPRAYVRDISKARKFATREEADRERCVENEVIVEVGRHE